MAIAYVGLGSNLGDRLSNLDRAVQGLSVLPHSSLLKASGVYETQPVGGPPGQGRFLNAVVVLLTGQEPVDLLASLKSLESRLGRQPGQRWGPRVIDLDLLAYDELVLDGPELSLPHPRLCERLFVLVPLAEVAPDWVHPVSRRSVGELLRLQAAGRTAMERRPDVALGAPAPAVPRAVKP